MADFTLDTSGAVHVGYVENPDGPYWGAIMWPDLSPFEQGYVEALFADRPQDWPGMSFDAFRDRGYRPIRFSDLHPETLAAMRKDCVVRRDHYAELKLFPLDRDLTAEDGRHFYERRQRGDLVAEGLPPLTPFLDDEGKVRLRG